MIANNHPPIRWPRVGLFMGLIYLLTVILDLALWLKGGLSSPAAVLALQTQMLLPAAVAIVLGMFVFDDSPIARRRVFGQAKVFLIGFLAFTLLYLGMTGAALFVPALAGTMSAVSNILNIIALLAVALLRLIRGRASFQEAGLAFGRPIHWLLYGGGMALFYVVSTALNWVFGLGHAPDLATAASLVKMTPAAFVAVATVQSALVSPFLGLLISFGEEYGWRGFLQSELIKIGRRRGILLLGVIWGAWHWPVIWMGYNFPGEPVLGSLLMVLYGIGLSFLFGYAVLKTGSVWLAAFMHAVNNQVLGTLASLYYTPNSAVYAFGMGIYGLALMAVIVLVLLRDPVWKETGQSETANVERIPA